MKSFPGNSKLTGSSLILTTEGIDFAKLTQEDARRAMGKLNNRPGKCLGLSVFIKQKNYV